MKAFLLYRDRDIDLERELPTHAKELEEDLGLDAVLDAMARGDGYLRPLAEHVLLNSLADPDAIRYRQDALRDCLEHRDVVRELYALSVEALESKRKAQVMWFRDSPDALLAKAVRILEVLEEALRRLRGIADDHGADFRSEAFMRLFATLQQELDDDYLATVRHHLRELRLKRGALISASLGRGSRGTQFVLREPHDRGLLERLMPGGPRSYSFAIPSRDEAGFQALAELRGRGINIAANALAQSTDHIVSFFAMLRAELGFYVGCLNLHEQLEELSEPTCVPEAADAGEVAFSASGLYDVALALHRGGQVVGNDVLADDKQLVVITGANEGGKSTFLRSAGLAQLMLQAGTFAPAESFRANTCSGVFTHFKREEDATMTKGKLDEELSRMSEIAERIAPAALLLCNESFASTNEREGSEIGRQVVGAMIEAGVKVLYVTHLFDLADSLYRQEDEGALFLRAERKEDGTRTFRVLPGEPLPTSFGKDSYRRVFGEKAASSPVRVRGAGS
jgi:hypothetical protein